MLDEISTKEMLEAKQPETMEEHIQVAQQGGSVARNARKELEKQTGKAVVLPLNNKKNILANSQGEPKGT